SCPIAARNRTSAYFRIRFDAVYALELCSRALDRLWRASGAHARFEGSSIQRNFRDLHAMSQHGGADIGSARSDYGKFLLDPEGFLATYSRRIGSNNGGAWRNEYASGE